MMGDYADPLTTDLTAIKKQENNACTVATNTEFIKFVRMLAGAVHCVSDTCIYAFIYIYIYMYVWFTGLQRA